MERIFKTNTMELKKINSRINLLKAQIEQLSSSGLFTNAEITKLSAQYRSELESLEIKAESLTDLPIPDICVKDATILDPNDCY